MSFDRDIKRFLISIFILLNVFTVLYVNRPLSINDIQGNKLKGILEAPTQQKSNTALCLFFSGYGDLVGLGTRWLMFILQDKYNWKYIIKARYEDSSEVVLPIPRQGNRTFLQREFFDFKEAKFQYNFKYRPYIKEHYASYLCKKFSVNNSSRIKSIIFELYKQNILDPKEAEKQNRYLEPIIRKEIAGVFNCSTRN